MTDKNLFTIGEIAKYIGITRRIILNYEEKGLIKPDKKDGVSGNRYYTIDTFTQIRTIRVFQKMGLSLDEIRDYFNGETDLNRLIERLENMRMELELSIEKLKERASGEGETVKEITIEPQTVYCRTYKTVSVADKTKLLRDTALEAMKLYGTDTTRRMYFTEISADAPDEVTYCIAVPPQSEGEFVRNIPLLKALSFFHHGAYEKIPDVRKRLVSYAEEKGLKLSGTFRSLYLEGPPQHSDKDKFITQVVAMIE
ncbi:MAG: MerR family transcriptional regulator [Oscillospiraceae bacterium]|nr:MerR family transcriptional regulator [Oscillospiraceae bacterium]